MDTKHAEFLLQDKLPSENAAQFLARQLIYIQLTKGIERSRIPTFVGTTQIGKTWWIRNVLAPSLDLPLVVLPLQSDLPEDVAGYPKHLGGDKLSMIKPAWLDTENATAYFFDELDKAQNEVTSPLLTFMCEGRVRQWEIAPGSIIICAMNESDEMIDAMKARLAFLQFTHTPRSKDIANLMGELSKANNVWKLKAKLPTQAKTPTSGEFLQEHMDILGRITGTPKILDTLLYGIFPPDAVEISRRWFTNLVEGNMLNVTEFVKRPDSLGKFIKGNKSDDTKMKGLMLSLVKEFVANPPVSEGELQSYVEDYFTKVFTHSKVNINEWFHLMYDDDWNSILEEKRDPEFALGKSPSVIPVNPADRINAILLGLNHALHKFGDAGILKLEQGIKKLLEEN